MKDLHEWFLNNQRDFPWRREKTPYRVWISEVMLQQTRAAVVVAYFEKWMALFPDVYTLAKASLETVIKTWEGLGYYSRARNLHAAAKEIVENFGGEIPSSPEKLEKIKGFGPYTIGALLSFGFQKRAPAVDGNVIRVLSRYLLIEENVCRPSVKKRIELRAEELLDQKEPWITAEALIELGATICTPKPRCDDCPIQKRCLAYIEKKAEALPIKDAGAKITELKRVVFLIEADGKILVKKGEKGAVMADLYEFPYSEKGKEKKFDLEMKKIRSLPEVVHSFTRYRARLLPILFAASFAKEIKGCQWISRADLKKLPFSSGHRKILEGLLI